MAAKELQKKNLIKAVEYFNKAHSIFGVAYCKFLAGDLMGAQTLLNLVKDSSPAVNWILALIGILTDKTDIMPTYLQVRTFYEQDLDMLFFYGHEDFAEKIIKKNKYIECFNKEVYKYTARVLLNYCKIDLAEKYIKKSLDIYYNDPETHFILGEIYAKQDKMQYALSEFSKSDKVGDGYMPAKTKLKELSVN